MLEAYLPIANVHVKNGHKNACNRVLMLDGATSHGVLTPESSLLLQTKGFNILRPQHCYILIGQKVFHGISVKAAGNPKFSIGRLFTFMEGISGAGALTVRGTAGSFSFKTWRKGPAQRTLHCAFSLWSMISCVLCLVTSETQSGERKKNKLARERLVIAAMSHNRNKIQKNHNVENIEEK